MTVEAWLTDPKTNAEQDPGRHGFGVLTSHARRGVQVLRLGEQSGDGPVTMPQRSDLPRSATV